MELNTLWFILIAVLFIGFFFLEGFDYGVGVLLPFLGKNDDDRRIIINSIGPFWDGNEVWLLTAGGAMFAAFPQMYATMFSGFYLALFLLLITLILRGVAFEFRSKDERPGWRNLWDWMIFIGSLVPAILWGVALSNLARGVAIDADMNYVGTFWDLLSPYSLLSGVASLAAFTLHGALFLSLKTEGEMAEKAHKTATRLWIPTVVVILVFVVASYASTDIFQKLGVNPGIAPLGAFAALLSIGYFIRERRHGWAFIASGVTLALSIFTIFSGLYPRLIISNLNHDWDLTIENASSSPYTLQVMTVVALIFVPIVLLYQGWTYWVFRKRITKQDVHY
ncbi:MAG TPA: cytochrome d ubiquinol oxidase subunit II [Phototrophicaceae bacterium]|nr:cytochrome d ubiquinol oxidase subunit II [Phototrophicaceae bacterium]